MREILFRGKRIDNGEWVKGVPFFTYPTNSCKMIQAMALHPDFTDEGDVYYSEGHSVDPSTVGQYTGLQDKNGKRIFEGDILKTHYANAKNSEFLEVVVFHNGRFCAEGNLAGNGRSWANLWDGVPHIPQDKTIYMDSMEVIGNIHDNPELLEGHQ